MKHQLSFPMSQLSEKDGRQEEKGVTEDEMVGWLHQLNEHEFEQTLVAQLVKNPPAMQETWV